MRRPAAFALGFLLLVLALFPGAVSAQLTADLTTSSVQLCDADFQQEIGITALTNTQNTTLYNISLWIVGAEPFQTQQLQLATLLPGSSAWSGDPFSVHCNESLPGSADYNLTYGAVNATHALAGILDEITIAIIPTPPVVETLTIEGATADGTQSGIPLWRTNEEGITLLVATDEEATCRAGTADASYASLQHAMDTLPGSTTHALDLELSQGSQTLYARCEDGASNTMTASAKAILAVDLTSPTLTIKRPLNWEVDTSLAIDVRTDETASCSYRFDPFGTPESLGSPSLTHTGTLTLAEGAHVLYVSCTDLAGNTQEKSHAFEVDIPPSAKIAMAPGPLRPGLYPINLTTSEALLSTPTLSYALSGKNAEAIPLEGSGKNWRGFLLLQDTGSEHVGSFTFSGTNWNARTGSEVTEGKLFVLDATPPPAPTDLDVSAGNSSLTLVWKYEGERPVSFAVYGSELPFVGYADYLTRVGSARYSQSIGLEGRVYFRVAAIDEAGNEGPLSDEIQVSFSLTEHGWTARVLRFGNSSSGYGVGGSGQTSSADTGSKSALDTLESDVESALLDIRVAQDLLKDSTEDFSGIGALGLEDALRESASELRDIQREIASLRSGASGEASADLLRLLRLRLVRIKSSTPRSVRVHDRFTLSYGSDEDASPLIREVLLTPSRSASAVEVTAAAIGEPPLSARAYDAFEKRYLAAIAALQQRLSVSRTSEVFDIEYIDGGSKKMTLITETISVEQAASGSSADEAMEGIDEQSAPDAVDGLDPLVMVHIPKSIASDISAIELITPGYEVIDSDPLIAYPDDVTQIQILVPEALAESQMRAIDTFLAYDPDAFSRAVSSWDTSWGLSAGLWDALGLGADGIQNLFFRGGIILVLLLGTYYLYLVKGDDLLLAVQSRALSTGRRSRPILRRRKHSPRHAQRTREVGESILMTDSVKEAEARQAEISHGLRELARLSKDLDGIWDRNAAEEAAALDIRMLRELEIVEALIREAETACTRKDFHAVKSLYAELTGRYHGLPPEYKKRVAGRSIKLYQWLTETKRLRGK